MRWYSDSRRHMVWWSWQKDVSKKKPRAPNENPLLPRSTPDPHQQVVAYILKSERVTVYAFERWLVSSNRGLGQFRQVYTWLASCCQVDSEMTIRSAARGGARSTVFEYRQWTWALDRNQDSFIPGQRDEGQMPSAMPRQVLK